MADVSDVESGVSRRRLADQPLTSGIKVPLSPDQRALIDRAAGSEPTTAWARRVLLHQAERVAGGLELDDQVPAGDDTEARVLELLQLVPRLDDAEIARRLEVTLAQVRGVRKAHGVPRAYVGGRRSGWEERVRAAVEAGATMAEIGEAEGWKGRSALVKVSRLGLVEAVRANEARRAGR